jgi:DNA-binding transcriptional regulator YiaG
MERLKGAPRSICGESGVDSKPERTYKLKTEAVEKCRRELSMSRQWLAKRAGVHVTTLRRWLKGGEAYPENVKALADALQTAPTNIVLGQFLAEATSTRFSVNFTVEAEAPSIESARTIVKWSQDTIRLLQKQGFKVYSHKTQVEMTEHERDLTRIIVLIYGKLENGNNFWLFAAVQPSQYHAFVGAQRAGSLDLYKFEPYGEIIVSGEGDSPPEEITLKVAEMYQTKPEILMQAMQSPDVPS